MRWPSSVNCACGRSRRNKSPPSSPSSWRMARVNEGWGNVAFLGGAREVERARHGEEIADLMHFHQRLPSMLANKWGRIINIASAHGLVGSPYKAAYVAAKHGMLARRLDARGGDVTPWGQRAPHPRLGEEGLTCCGRSDPSAGQRRAARRSCRRCSSTSARYPWSRRRPHRPCARSARRSCWHIPRPGPRRCR